MEMDMREWTKEWKKLEGQTDHNKEQTKEGKSPSILFYFWHFFGTAYEAPGHVHMVINT